VEAAAQHLQGLTSSGGELGFIKILVLPDIMQKIFFHGR
jgi:hypothetical protein